MIFILSTTRDMGTAWGHKVKEEVWSYWPLAFCGSSLFCLTVLDSSNYLPTIDHSAESMLAEDVSRGSNPGV